jgi:hypothetical protein
VGSVPFVDETRLQATLHLGRQPPVRHANHDAAISGFPPQAQKQPSHTLVNGQQQSAYRGTHLLHTVLTEAPDLKRSSYHAGSPQIRTFQIELAATDLKELLLAPPCKAAAEGGTARATRQMSTMGFFILRCHHRPSETQLARFASLMQRLQGPACSPPGS